MAQKLLFSFLSFALLHGSILNSQTTEDFESESAGSSTFTNNGQTFTISSTVGENYNVFTNGYNDGGGTDTCSGCGWNGSGTDNKFVDNTGGANHNGSNNGTSFTITSGGAEFGVTSLYLFCSTLSVTAHSGTLTITGKKGGINQYTITKNSGFANVVSFTPNNGFTLIDFATEGSSDFTQIKIDELVFTGSGNLDYLALDGFTWAEGTTLSSESIEKNSEFNIYPNPTSDFIQIIGIEKVNNYIMYNVLGHKISQGTIDKNEKLDIRNLSNGLYIIRLDNNIPLRFIKK